MRAGGGRGGGCARWLAFVALAGAAGAQEGGLCGGREVDRCRGSALCFWDEQARECQNARLPCAQYQSDEACAAAKGCRTLVGGYCLPREDLDKEDWPAAPDPPDPSCRNIRRARNCKRRENCVWDYSRFRALGRRFACRDEMPSACAALQSNKLCRSLGGQCEAKTLLTCVPRRRAKRDCDCTQPPGSPQYCKACGF